MTLVIIELPLHNDKMSDVKSEVSIKPEDSVSHCDDGAARSAVSSTSSSASRLHVKAKARRAAEAEGLRRLQELEIEQLKLKQKRSQLELQTRLDIAVAEEHVYASLCDEGKSSHTSQHKSSVNPPLAAASRLPDS